MSFWNLRRRAFSNWYKMKSVMLHLKSCHVVFFHAFFIEISLLFQSTMEQQKNLFFPLVMLTINLKNIFHPLISGMPMELYNIWFPSAFPFSEIVCVLQGLFSETSTNATILTITSFTCERYIAICHPFRWDRIFLYPCE